MKTPKRLQSLLEDGLIDEVIRPLKSGKEAAIYVVRSGAAVRCAKVYKEADRRGFRQAVQYQEGRTVRNSRRARAMEKGTRYGRAEQEQAWQSAEVQALYRLAAAGVRVPQPHCFVDGVLLMELVVDETGSAAPRLGDVTLTEEQALAFHAALIRDVVRMLCAGTIHGDLSEYNILVAADGPVIIDLPQAVDAAGNNSAAALFERDVANLAACLGRFAPVLADTDYGPEIWQSYQSGTLTPDQVLTGRCARIERTADVREVMREIGAARDEEWARRRRQQQRDQE